MKTTKIQNSESIQRKWFIIDANDMALGRFASKVSFLLSGKRKPGFSPNQDHGDNVIIINANKVRITGNKANAKTYFRHSQHVGTEKHIPYATMMKRDSRKIIRLAVHGMLPKNPLGRAMIKKLHVYTGDVHPHVAQKPETITL